MTASLSELPQLAFTTAEAARLLGLIPSNSIEDPAAILKGQRRVYELIRAGRLRARRLGKSYIVPRQEIERYLDGADEPIRHPDSVAV